MSLHFLNNFIALMLFFVLGKDQISTPMEVSFSDLKVSVISFLGLTVLFSMLILYMNRYYYKVKKSDDHNDNNKNKTGYY
jgi:membrane protein implicated in regulation of membrane protease activity